MKVLILAGVATSATFKRGFNIRNSLFIRGLKDVKFNC